MAIAPLSNMIRRSICSAVNMSVLTAGLISTPKTSPVYGKEGEISLRVFLDMCQEDGVEPRKEYSGKFNLRVSPQLHAEIATRAMAAGKSLNQWVADILDESLHLH